MAADRIRPIFPDEDKRAAIWIHSLHLTPEDTADISAALIAAFPTVVFRAPDWSDIGSAKLYPDPPDPRVAEARRIERLPDALREAQYRYASHLTDYPDQARIRVYILPEGWSPIWRRNAEGDFFAVNAPTCFFDFFRSTYFSTLTRTAQLKPRAIAASEERLQLTDGWFVGNYDWGNREQARVLRRCRRTIAKLTTNRFVQVDKKTDRIVRRIEGGETTRIGFHALRWAAEHPRHYIGEDLKPYDWQPPRESAEP